MNNTGGGGGGVVFSPNDRATSSSSEHNFLGKLSSSLPVPNAFTLSQCTASHFCTCQGSGTVHRPGRAIYM